MDLDLEELDDLLAEFEDDYGIEELNLVALTSQKIRRDTARLEEQARSEILAQVRKVRDEFFNHRMYLRACAISNIRRLFKQELYVGCWSLRRALKPTGTTFDLLLTGAALHKIRLRGVDTSVKSSLNSSRSILSLVYAAPVAEDPSVISLCFAAAPDSLKQERAAAVVTSIGAAAANSDEPEPPTDVDDGDAPSKRIPLREGPSAPGVYERLFVLESGGERDCLAAGLAYALSTGVQRITEASVLPAPAVFQSSAACYFAPAAVAGAPIGVAAAVPPLELPTAFDDQPAVHASAMRPLVIANDRIVIGSRAPWAAADVPFGALAVFPLSAVKKLRIEAVPPAVSLAAKTVGAPDNFGIDGTLVIELSNGRAVRLIAAPPVKAAVLANEVRIALATAGLNMPLAVLEPSLMAGGLFEPPFDNVAVEVAVKPRA